jgi:calcineurin-like phosphoesterase family protein
MIHTWFTADFHLGHQNIIRYCNRPFHSTGEMDEAILANLNSLVRQDDVLYSAWADPSRRGVIGIGLSAAISTSLN